MATTILMPPFSSTINTAFFNMIIVVAGYAEMVQLEFTEKPNMAGRFG